MKSGNTLRVARNSLLCFFMALVASFLVACGGGGGGGGGDATPRDPSIILARPAAPAVPAVPAVPSASAQSDIEILVTWSAVSGATSYKLYRSPSSGGTPTQVGGDISALRRLDSGRSPNTEYFYQLEACNTAGCSSPSPEVSVTTQPPPAAPARPSTPSASAQSDTEIEVTWSAVSGAASYKLYRSPSSGGTYIQVGGDISARRYLDSGRSANTEYFYQLEACNRGGCSEMRSPEVSVTTALARPAMPSASAQSDTEISVTWSAVSGATSYRLYRSPSSGGAYTRVGGDISALSYLDSGRSAGTEYFYQLEACNSGGCSSRSPEVSVTTPPDAPAQPSASAQSDTEIEVTWSAVSGAASYKLYRSPSSGGTYIQVGGDISARRYLDSGRSANTEYFYQLEACNRGGCSEMRSPEVSVTTALARPAMPSASAQSDTEISVTWSAVSGATSYRLYRSPSSGGAYTRVGGDISALSYLDSGRSAGTEYFYQLEACNSAGCSSRSPEVSATTAPARPATPSASAQSDTEIEVTWSAVSGATSYKLYRSPSSGGTYTQVGGDISALRYLDSGRSANTEYFYQLEACNAAGCSATRSPAGSATTAPARPAMPSASAQSDTEISVTWSAVSGATSYRLYRSPSSGGAYTRVGGDISALSYLDSGRSAGTEYFYQLEACNSAGCSSRSPEVSATTAPARPATPSASAQSDTAIEVTWSAVSGATNYRLYRSPSSGGTYTRVGGDISALSYLDSGRSADTEYFYQLEACNSAGCSSRSLEVSATTLPVAPTQPSAPSASAQSESEILVTWSAVSGATSYKLYRSPSSGGSYAQIGGDISALSYLDSGRSADTEYFYQLEACNSGGCSSRSPEVSATTPLVAPAQPAMPSASAQSDTEISVTWSAVSGATSYRLYRSPSSGGTYTRVGGDISALSYLDSGRSADTEYFYQLEACNSAGCSSRSLEVSATTNLPPAFSTHLDDAAVEGAEYSGPTGKGLTGKGGVFPANEGVFEFSIGGTTLGSVRLNSDWANSHVTPADFIGVDEEKVIDIARIMQGLDGDGDPENGISISQSVRENAPDLFGDIDGKDGTVAIVIGGETFMIPPKDEATDHFVATRKCLFSGGYAGSYRATSVSYSGRPDEGRIYYILEPFANRARGVEFSDIYPSGNDFALESISITVGAIGSVITLSLGNELSFVTPRLVTGIWTYSDEDESERGINSFTLVAGDPGATRRVVGVETDNSTVAIGLYALDYFADGSFRGGYYDVKNDEGLFLSLTIAGGGSWPAVTGMTATLTLSGTLGEEDTAVTVEVIRKDENYGSFDRGVGTQELSGTWCDIGGATGVAVPPPQTPPAPSASARSESEIEVTWSAVSGATSYNLYRSTSRGGTYFLVAGDIFALRYLDSELFADTTYYYQLDACNSIRCSRNSPAGSATTQASPPAAPPAPSASAQSDTEIEVTWNAVSGATSYKLYRSTSSGGTYTRVGGDISALRYLDTGRSASTGIFLSVGGLQQRRVFGDALARRFGHHPADSRCAGATAGAERVSAKRYRD